MPPILRRAGASARSVGRIELSSPLDAGDLVLLSGLSRHWQPDGDAALVPCAVATPQEAAESLRRILSTVLAPRGIRLHGTVTILAGGRRAGTVSVKHGRVTAHQLGRRGPVQADRSAEIDLAVPADVEAPVETPVEPTQSAQPAQPTQPAEPRGSGDVPATSAEMPLTAPSPEQRPGS